MAGRRTTCGVVCLAILAAISFGLLAVPAGAARPRTAAACAHAGTPVKRASAPELRTAVVCLINRARRAWGLPAVHERAALDAAAQDHATQMVQDDYFGHTSPDGSDPGQRLDQGGFRWSAWGEAIYTGVSTPRRVVAAWLSSQEHCQILLSPAFREAGIGVSARAVRGFASHPGTWTADFALGLTQSAPSADSRPAASCPH